ncbi:MAG: hypothetical protein HW416_3974 [Chloroflexi bacterium]|nr:hypothetical protein [Chloroflexota bacterium]
MLIRGRDSANERRARGSGVLGTPHKGGNRIMTRIRKSLVSVAGLVSTFLVLGGLGLTGSALAQQPPKQQPTQTELKAKAKAAAVKAQIKWASLSPDQQEQVKTTWKADVAKAQAKWDAMTPEQQQQYIAKAKAGSKKVAEVWQSLPQ